MTSSVTIKYNTNYKNISSRKSYISSQFMKTINIENENFFRLQSNNIKLDLNVYNFIKSLKMDFLIFREAYFNQRKKYKLLGAHIYLINKFIDEDEYDKIEDECMIEINEYNEDISINALYAFLKNHNHYEDIYDANELSELLGIDYNQIKKFLNGRNIINENKKDTSK